MSVGITDAGVSRRIPTRIIAICRSKSRVQPRKSISSQACQATTDVRPGWLPASTSPSSAETASRQLPLPCLVRRVPASLRVFRARARREELSTIVTVLASGFARTSAASAPAMPVPHREQTAVFEIVQAGTPGVVPGKSDRSESRQEEGRHSTRWKPAARRSRAATVGEAVYLAFSLDPHPVERAPDEDQCNYHEHG